MVLISIDKSFHGIRKQREKCWKQKYQFNNIWGFVGNPVINWVSRSFILDYEFSISIVTIYLLYINLILIPATTNIKKLEKSWNKFTLISL